MRNGYIARITLLFYNEKEHHTVGYSHKAKRACEGDNLKNQSFKDLVGESKEQIVHVARIEIEKFLQNRIENVNFKDFGFYITFNEVKEYQFYPINPSPSYHSGQAFSLSEE